VNVPIVACGVVKRLSKDGHDIATIWGSEVMHVNDISSLGVGATRKDDNRKNRKRKSHQMAWWH
jgi:hypothetical protein